MPLSNDFTNTRLSYLQDAIKNSKVVAKQFYPRFVREYNEQFPFTEPKLSSIGNPIGNTAIKDYLKKPSDEQVIENLTTKINSLTNDENITKYIVDALGEQLSISALKYYDENFNTIQKQISISRDGIGKDAFVDKVLGTLRNDPHTKNLSIYDSTPYKVVPDTPEVELEDFLEQRPVDLRDLLMPKRAFLRDTIDFPDALPVMEQVYDGKIPSEGINELQNVQGKPENKRGRKWGIGNTINMELSSDEEYLAEYNRLKAKSKSTDIPTYEKWLYNYQEAQRAHEAQREKKNRVAEEIKQFKGTPKKKNTPPRYPTPNPILNAKKYKTQPATQYKIQSATQSATPDNKTRFSGVGIQLKPLRIQNRIIKHKQVFNNNKYAIDTKKLKKNILDLKYVKNANHVATFQPIEISDKLRYIIDNIIKDFYNVQNEDFNNLNTTEKRILKRLFTFLNIQNNTLNDSSSYSDKNDSIQHNFEVAYGSFLAGNDNKELINELIQYVKLALHENNISKKDGYEILKKLNNK